MFTNNHSNTSRQIKETSRSVGYTARTLSNSPRMTNLSTPRFCLNLSLPFSMDDTCLVPCVIGSCPLGREGRLGCHVVPYISPCHGQAALHRAGCAVDPTILEVPFICLL